jgi:hypothetical protein
LKRKQLEYDLDNLIDQYEQELSFLKNRNMLRFDVEMLPDIIKKFVKLAVTKTPSFSNVAAITMANHALAHVFGQVRPYMSDPVYSNDSIGLNTYALIISKSGSGKDITYQTAISAVKDALEFIGRKHKNFLEDKAKKDYVKKAKKENPNFDETSVTIDDYRDLIKSPEDSIGSLSSSRGGLTSSLNRMSRDPYGTMSIFASELALSIKSSPLIMEVLELVSVLFDMGRSVAPKFKDKGAQEESVDGMFINFLGISSPTLFYEDGPVKRTFVPMLTTALARRLFTVFSDSNEEFENEYIPKTPMEKRSLKHQARLTISQLSAEINETVLKSVKNLDIGSDISLMFSEEAMDIYDDYKGYTEELSKKILMSDPNSVIGIEMSGRAFKMGRVAGLWSLAQGKKIIDKDTLIAAIYFADYTARHLERFSNTLDMESYEIFVEDWKQGYFKDDRITLAQAITKGYITTSKVSKSSLETFLKPVNSLLHSIAVVEYNEESHEFIFTPLVIHKSNEVTFEYKISKRHTTRSEELDINARNKPINIFDKILRTNCSYTPFIEDTTKFIVLKVDSPLVPELTMSKYLDNVYHHIVKRPDESGYTILLPINIAISNEEYKYVCITVARMLLIHIKPEYCEWDYVHMSYDNSKLLYESIDRSSELELFDISGVKGAYASNTPLEKLPNRSISKSTKGQIEKYIKEEVSDVEADIIEIINTSSNSMLTMAQLTYDMLINGVEIDRAREILLRLNISLKVSIPEEDIEEFILSKFVNI